MMRRLLRAVFYRGRHHVHTAPRDDAGQLVTVTTIAARIRREARHRAYGSVHLTIVPDVSQFGTAIHRALEEWAESCANAAPEQLGALSV